MAHVNTVKVNKSYSKQTFGRFANEYKKGNSSVIVGIFGPVEVRGRDELMDRAFIQVVYNTASGITTPNDRDKEEYIRQTFQSVILSTMFPRTKISIIIQEVNDDGSLLATIINATTLALMDAGIPIKSLIAACSTVIFNSSDEITKKNVDINGEREKDSRAQFLFAFNSSESGVTTSRSLGVFSEEEYWKVLELSRDCCKQVFSAMRKCIQFKEQR